MKNKINLNRSFVGNFFGLKDEWNTSADKRTFLSKEDVIELFKDFDILEFEEFERKTQSILQFYTHEQEKEYGVVGIRIKIML